MRVSMQLLGCLLPLVLCATAHAAVSQHRNVLFIAVDDLRVELGCYGQPQVQTPNIDGLAARGMTFTHAYCQQAVCNPSRASVLTGLRPDTLKVWDLPTHFREHHPDLITLPQWFKQKGYFTQDVGKIFHNFRQDEWKGDPVSWSVPAVLHYGSHSMDRPLIDGKLPADISTLRKLECRDVPDEAYYDGRVAELAVKALQEMGDKPFFLAVGFWKPHLPFNAPKKYWDLYDRAAIDVPVNPLPPEGCPPIALTHAPLKSKGKPTVEEIKEARHGHYAAISFLDAQVGKVLDELKRQNLDRNTVVVFWSDHGLHVGERGHWSKNSNFELDTRVPLIIAAPELPSSSVGTKADGLVELVDLFPTLLELCNLESPHPLQGESLVPMLTDPAIKLKQVALSQHPRPKNPRGKNFAQSPPDVMGYSLRTERYRFTQWRHFSTGKVQARELYDHSKDPLETVNIVDQTDTETVAVLEHLMEEAIEAGRQHQ